MVTMDKSLADPAVCKRIGDVEMHLKDCSHPFGVSLADDPAAVERAARMLVGFGFRDIPSSWEDLHPLAVEELLKFVGRVLRAAETQEDTNG